MIEKLEIFGHCKKNKKIITKNIVHLADSANNEDDSNK